MLVAISPSVHRLRMSSLDYHGDATSSHSANHSKSIAQGGAASATDPEYMAISHGRPKLSLQTSTLPSPYAKSSKGVLGSASPLSGAATPTISNTIANSVQAIPLRPSPVTPRSPFSKASTSRPYAQPIGLRSILKHSGDSPKLGIKRSHSLFSADSDSPHTRRRVFFPPHKQVKFEGDDKLAVEIPAKELSLPESGSTETEPEIIDQKDAVSVAVYDEQEDEGPSALAIPPKVMTAPRTRNGTPPPPKSTTPRKKRKVRKWEWTIKSPRVMKPEDSK